MVVRHISQKMLLDLQGRLLSYFKKSSDQECPVVLSTLSVEIRKKLVNVVIDGETPLIVVARNGHSEAAKYLVEECQADVNLRGSVKFDNEIIEGASPLWCAAAAGHLTVVKYLIEHKADCNCRTLTNSTPMRAACFDGHLDIVQYLLEQGSDIEIANRHNHTNLMIACYKGHVEIVRTLLDAGAKVNRQSAKKNTALHDCAESGNIEIAKLLLDHGAIMQKDVNKISPLMAAAISGHPELVKFFCEQLGVRIEEQVQAFELIGCTYMDIKQETRAAHESWSSALFLRKKHDLPLTYWDDREPGEIYANIKEPRTMEELSEAALELDTMRMLSLMIRERVLGRNHTDTTYYIRYRGAIYADAENFDKCMELWVYALKLQRANPEHHYHLTISNLLSFCDLFNFLLRRRSEDREYYKLDYDFILKLLQDAVAEIPKNSSSSLKSTTEKSSACEQKHSSSATNRPQQCNNNNSTSGNESDAKRQQEANNNNSNNNNNQHEEGPLRSTLATSQVTSRAMYVTLHLASLSIQALLVEKKLNWSPFVKEEDERDEDKPENCPKRSAILSQIRYVTNVDGQTLLHLAAGCDAAKTTRNYAPQIPSALIVRSLVRAGYDPNRADSNGRTPLHHAALACKRTPEVRGSVGAFKALHACGAHVDYRDAEGVTPFDSFTYDDRYTLGITCQRLACLAARRVSALMRDNPAYEASCKPSLGLLGHHVMLH